MCVCVVFLIATAAFCTKIKSLRSCENWKHLIIPPPTKKRIPVNDFKEILICELGLPCGSDGKESASMWETPVPPLSCPPLPSGQSFVQLEPSGLRRGWPPALFFSPALCCACSRHFWKTDRGAARGTKGPLPPNVHEFISGLKPYC